MFATASTGQHYFDAFNIDILDPATSSQIFITLLVFLACWDFIISLTTGPALGPILRGIIQARALSGHVLHGFFRYIYHPFCPASSRLACFDICRVPVDCRNMWFTVY